MLSPPPVSVRGKSASVYDYSTTWGRISSEFIHEVGGQGRQINCLSCKGVGAIAAETELTRDEEVVANEWDEVSSRVMQPFPRPAPVLFLNLKALVLEARAECRGFKVMVKSPAIGEDVFLLAGGTPMQVTIYGSA